MMQPGTLAFRKMSGAGNDFVVIDNRSGAVSSTAWTTLAQELCPRRTSIGADGLLVLERAPHPNVHFGMRYFNPDGSETMCGNGARCLAQFAVDIGAAPEAMRFTAADGDHRAWILPDGVRLEMPEPWDIQLYRLLDVPGSAPLEVHTLNTGVPHVVVNVSDLSSVDVRGQGAALRHHPDLGPAGANVNFVHTRSPQDIAVRTFERGVESETLACGTGIVACALALALTDQASSPVRVLSLSGKVLTVDFTRCGTRATDITLSGEARTVYQGVVRRSALAT